MWANPPQNRMSGQLACAFRTYPHFGNPTPFTPTTDPPTLHPLTLRRIRQPLPPIPQRPLGNRMPETPATSPAPRPVLRRLISVALATHPPARQHIRSCTIGGAQPATSRGVQVVCPNFPKPSKANHFQPPRSARSPVKHWRSAFFPATPAEIKISPQPPTTSLID